MTELQLTKPADASEPLRFPVFRALWIATIISNVGTWMHDVGECAGRKGKKKHRQRGCRLHQRDEQRARR